MNDLSPAPRSGRARRRAATRPAGAAAAAGCPVHRDRLERSRGHRRLRPERCSTTRPGPPTRSQVDVGWRASPSRARCRGSRSASSPTWPAGSPVPRSRSPRSRVHHRPRPGPGRAGRPGGRSCCPARSHRRSAPALTRDAEPDPDPPQAPRRRPPQAPQSPARSARCVVRRRSRSGVLIAALHHPQDRNVRRLRWARRSARCSDWCSARATPGCSWSASGGSMSSCCSASRSRSACSPPSRPFPGAGAG